MWGVESVCAEAELQSLLEKLGQAEWNTRTKRNGLLALQDLMLRLLEGKKAAISLDCSHGYVSPFKRAKSADTIREPLAVLCNIGIWRKVQDAVNHHVKNSAIYALTSEYEKRKRMSVKLHLPPGQKRRLEAAPERNDKRLNGKSPWRKQLICDQEKLGFAPNALRDVAALLQTTKEEAIKRALKAIVEGQHEQLRMGVTGTILCSVNGIPKELKPRLTVGGEPAAECDISHAHHCFLPVLLRERIKHRAGDELRDGYVAECELEFRKLTAFLSHGDYYEKWCDDQKEPRQRDEVKKLATQLLNMPNERAQRIPLYRKMREKFPCVFAVVEDLKRGDHRNIYKQLQRFTANVIEAALLRAQARGIPAFPDTDALHVPESHREEMCKIIGEEMAKATGVFCKVGGIRYSPTRTVRAEQAANPQTSTPALIVLEDAPKAKMRTEVKEGGSSAKEMLNNPLVRLAHRMFNADPMVEITTAEGLSYKVPMWG